MMQMTGAAFQAQANLKEQVTDPTSHTPVTERLPNQGVPRHLLIPMVDPFFLTVDSLPPGSATDGISQQFGQFVTAFDPQLPGPNNYKKQRQEPHNRGPCRFPAEYRICSRSAA
jgi:hypothetical protein